MLFDYISFYYRTFSYLAVVVDTAHKRIHRRSVCIARIHQRWHKHTFLVSMALWLLWTSLTVTAALWLQNHLLWTTAPLANCPRPLSMHPHSHRFSPSWQFLLLSPFNLHSSTSVIFLILTLFLSSQSSAPSWSMMMIQMQQGSGSTSDGRAWKRVCVVVLMVLLTASVRSVLAWLFFRALSWSYPSLFSHWSMHECSHGICTTVLFILIIYIYIYIDNVIIDIDYNVFEKVVHRPSYLVVSLKVLYFLRHQN